MGGSGGGRLEEVETQENEQPLLVFEWCGMTGGTGNPVETNVDAVSSGV